MLNVLIKTYYVIGMSGEGCMFPFGIVLFLIYVDYPRYLGYMEVNNQIKIELQYTSGPHIQIRSITYK